MGKSKIDMVNASWKGIKHNTQYTIHAKYKKPKISHKTITIDVLDVFFEKIERETDQTSSCLVSKDLKELVQPVLALLLVGCNTLLPASELMTSSTA